MGIMNQRKAGVILSYFNKLMNMGINLVYVPLLLFYMGTHEYGLYQLMGSVVAYIGLLDFGFSVAVSRFYTEYKALQDQRHMENLLATSAILYTALGLIVLFVGGILYFFLGDIFGASLTAEELISAHKIYILLVVNVLLLLESQIFAAVINAEERFFFLRGLSTISIILQPIVVLFVMQVSPYAYSFVLIQTLFYTASTLAQVFYAIRKLHMKVRYHGFDQRMVRSVTSFSLTFFIICVIDQVFARSNQVILGILSGTAVVAVYSIGAQIYMSYTPLATIITGVFFPKVTQMAALHRPVAEFSDLFIRLGRLQFLFIGLVLSGFAMFGQRFIHFWVGDAFADAYWIALFVILPFTFDIIQSLGSTIMQARNELGFRAKVGAVTGILNIVLVIPAAMYFGGAACAAVSGFIVFMGNCVAMDWYYWRVLKLDILLFWKNVFKIGIGIIVFMGIDILLNFLVHQAGIQPIRELILQICLYMGLYLVGMRKFVLNTYEIGLWKQGLRKLHLGRLDT